MRPAFGGNWWQSASPAAQALCANGRARAAAWIPRKTQPQSLLGRRFGRLHKDTVWLGYLWPRPAIDG